METKRDYLQLDDEFYKANGIVSCIGDLLRLCFTVLQLPEK